MSGFSRTTPVLCAEVKMTLEQRAFLRRSLAERRVSDGLKYLAQPLRVSLYRMRKQGRRAPVRRLPVPYAIPNGLRVRAARAPFLPVLDPDILRPLFAEVDAQLGGTFRLAGAVVRRIAIENTTGLTDEEEIHGLHRLQWAVRYAQAAAFGRPDALSGLVRDLSRWFEGAADRSTLASWPYTLAERISSFKEVLFWAPTLSRELELQIAEQVWQDAQQLSATIEYGLGIHNHLLNDARGLYAASVILPDAPQAQAWRNTAFDLWERFFPSLVLDDGSLAEQSSHYHLLLCRTALEYILAARQESRPLPVDFEPKLHAMFALANDLLRSDGSLPRFGDNSPDRTITDLWGLLPAASHHGVLNEYLRHQAITPLTIYYTGDASTSSCKLPGAKTRLYSQGGYAFLRSPELAAEVTAHADPSPATGAHGDAGRGSFELWWRGRVILREPGCYLSSRAHRLAGAEQQNVTCLDGLGPSVSREDQKYLPAWYWKQTDHWRQTGPAEVQLECNAFRRLHADLQLTRTWSLNDSAVTLREEVTGSRPVTMTSRIFLGEGYWRSVAKPGLGEFQTSARFEDGTKARLTFRFPETMEARVEHSLVSPEYGVEEFARVVVLNGRCKLPADWSLTCEFID
jgi:Heparinase II/III N-terminus/Heparinase II/III-like protein